MNFIWFKCNEIKKKFNYRIKTSIMDSNNIIISTDYDEIYSNPGIYKLNLKTNIIKQIFKYPKNCFAKNHGQFIDKKDNTLYIFGGNYHSYRAVNLS